MVRGDCIMSFRRTNYGEKRYEVRVSILGQRVLLGYFQYRSQAAQAEEIALTIRKALERANVIKRKESKEISFSNLNQTEQAANKL